MAFQHISFVQPIKKSSGCFYVEKLAEWNMGRLGYGGLSL